MCKAKHSALALARSLTCEAALAAANVEAGRHDGAISVAVVDSAGERAALEKHDSAIGISHGVPTGKARLRPCAAGAFEACEDFVNAGSRRCHRAALKTTR